VRAELRRLYSPDADPLPAFQPDDPECFGVFVQAFVGPQGGEGEESFGFMVCTARWLEGRSFEKGFAWGRHHLFLKRWDYSVLERVVRDLCTHAEGPDWESVAARVARYGHWEFEDYVE
jgi:hypothetical protein